RQPPHDPDRQEQPRRVGYEQARGPDLLDETDEKRAEDVHHESSIREPRAEPVDHGPGHDVPEAASEGATDADEEQSHVARSPCISQTGSITRTARERVESGARRRHGRHSGTDSPETKNSYRAHPVGVISRLARRRFRRRTPSPMAPTIRFARRTTSRRRGTTAVAPC